MDKKNGNSADQMQIPARKDIESPSGLDLYPQPGNTVRISKRAGMAIVAGAALLLLAFAYGGYRRTLTTQAALRDAGLPKGIAPATQAGAEFLQAAPSVEGFTTRAEKLVLPESPMFSQTMVSPCGADARTGHAYRFNPQTGQPCGGLSRERIVIRQIAPTPQALPSVPAPVHEQTTEERHVTAAYQQEQAAIQAPTTVCNSTASSLTGPEPIANKARTAIDDFSQIETLSRALARGRDSASILSVNGQPSENDYDSQSMQSRKEAFLVASRDKHDNYLHSTREAPLSRFEIKAGWEIPAVLEQAVNSDLPGDLKALVTSNVYDTATGLYLLIPQGSRLIGKYDSRVAYGQDGVQVSWNRIVYPDASSVHLDGMPGLDSQGNAGLRDKVDRHYRRVLGFSVLTSLFTAAFQISQRTNQAPGAYPNASQTAANAIGQELSQTGAQITRRNLNVQPTIKVPPGYKFVVRVNRDILFEAPYTPIRQPQ